VSSASAQCEVRNTEHLTNGCIERHVSTQSVLKIE